MEGKPRYQVPNQPVTFDPKSFAAKQAAKDKELVDSKQKTK